MIVSCNYAFPLEVDKTSILGQKRGSSNNYTCKYHMKDTLLSENTILICKNN